MSEWTYFWLFLKASLFSTGGFGNLPSLHADLTAAHAANDQDFAEALTVGQISPGPNGLWSVSLGYLVNGVPGALLACLALTLPPLLVLLVERLYRRVQDHPAVEGFMRGLALAVVGIFAVVLFGFLKTAGWNWPTLSFFVIAALLACVKRVPPGAILALAAVGGILFSR